MTWHPGRFLWKALGGTSGEGSLDGDPAPVVVLKGYAPEMKRAVLGLDAAGIASTVTVDAHGGLEGVFPLPPRCRLAVAAGDEARALDVLADLDISFRLPPPKQPPVV